MPIGFCSHRQPPGEDGPNHLGIALKCAIVLLCPLGSAATAAPGPASAGSRTPVHGRRGGPPRCHLPPPPPCSCSHGCTPPLSDHLSFPPPPPPSFHPQKMHQRREISPFIQRQADHPLPGPDFHSFQVGLGGAFGCIIDWPPGGTALITSDCGEMRSFAQRWVTWTCCSRFTCHINRETFARTGRGLNLAHQLANASTTAPTKRRSHALALTSRRLSKAADCWEGSLRRVIAERAYESQTVY